MPPLDAALDRFLAALDRAEKGITAPNSAKPMIARPQNQAKNLSPILDFKRNKQDYYSASADSALKEIKKELWALAPAADKNDDTLIDLLLLFRELERKRKNAIEASEVIRKMKSLNSTLTSSRTAVATSIPNISFRMPSLPAEISSEVSADIKELEKSFNAGLYRSTVILCGRVLETCLHRKYFEATGNDLLEKSPGIGLGNMIAKLKEKNIELDPAITQQIHLVNQVRIFSVHKKQVPFCPSREQAHAMILYTLDIAGRMW